MSMCDTAVKNYNTMHNYLEQAPDIQWSCLPGKKYVGKD